MTNSPSSKSSCINFGVVGGFPSRPAEDPDGLLLSALPLDGILLSALPLDFPLLPPSLSPHEWRPCDCQPSPSSSPFVPEIRTSLSGLSEANPFCDPLPFVGCATFGPDRLNEASRTVCFRLTVLCALGSALVRKPVLCFIFRASRSGCTGSKFLLHITSLFWSVVAFIEKSGTVLTKVFSNVFKFTFIMSCISPSGRSFGSSPKGISISDAIRFKQDIRKTVKNAATPAAAQLFVKEAEITGAMIH
mmetsp:Transcript_35245/g.64437  ORF Transcript_35245/g.64437 Transcript_35245/m.64437 type:complete len:247 (+) Transcript_35245:325-1065(+)